MSTFNIVFPKRIEDLFSYSKSSAVWTVNLSLVLVLVTMAIYYYRRNNKSKVLFKRIPGPKVNGIITNVVPLLSIFRNKSASNRVLFFQMICAYSHVFRKEGMWLFWGGIRKILIIYKAETVEPVLSSNDILSKGFEYDFLTDMLKEGLLTSKRNKWRYRRKLLTPSFHFRILDEFIPVFNEQAKILTTKLSHIMEKEAVVNIAPIVSLCTLDIICETAMGKKINAQFNSTYPYVQALHKFCQMAIERMIRPWLWPDFMYYFTREGKEFKECLKIMDQFTRQVIAERKSEMLKYRNTDNQIDSNGNDEIGRKNKKRLALLDTLLDLHLKDSSFTLEDVAEEVDNFMFAGHDTTSSGLSFAFYMLGLHPDIQERAQQEVDDVLGDDENRPITIDEIKELKYLDCILKETRRLWPPTPFIARDLEEDTYIDGCLIPKGTSCGILIHMLHRDPDVFPNPEVFDPDRFDLSNCAGRHPFAYVPFSAGPRNCIGQRFATFEAITVLATVLRKFNLKSIDPLDKIHIVDDLVLRAENGLRMTLQPRKKEITQILT